jgi:hypothetical protein
MRTMMILLILLSGCAFKTTKYEYSRGSASNLCLSRCQADKNNCYDARRLYCKVSKILFCNYGVCNSRYNDCYMICGGEVVEVKDEN